MAECSQQLSDAHQPNSGRISNGIDSRKFGLAQALSVLFVLVTRQGRFAARYSPIQPESARPIPVAIDWRFSDWKSMIFRKVVKGFDFENSVLTHVFFLVFIHEGR